MTEYLHNHLITYPPPLAELRRELRKVLKAHPELCDRGLSVPGWRTMSGREHDAKLSELRAQMLTDDGIGEFYRGLVFAAAAERLGKRRTINWAAGGYDFKHHAEEYAQLLRLPDPYGADGSWYVSPGAAIAALLHFGFRYETAMVREGYRKLGFNISSRVLDIVPREQERQNARSCINSVAR